MGFFDDVRATIDRQQRRRGSSPTTCTSGPSSARSTSRATRRSTPRSWRACCVCARRPSSIRRRRAQGIEEAKSAYEKKGYLDADIRYETDAGRRERGRRHLPRSTSASPIRIQHIEFEGNKQFTDSELKRIMQTGERVDPLASITGAGNLDREVLKTDTERLTAYYYENGFIDVRVDEPKIERAGRRPDGHHQDRRGRAVPLRQRSAPRARRCPRSRKRSRAKFEAQEGEIFKPSLLRKDINRAHRRRTATRLRVRQRHAGRPTSTRRTSASNVTYTVTRGPAVSIDRIEISGNTKTRDKVIRRELELEEQQPFSGTAPAPQPGPPAPPRLLRGREHHHPQGRHRGQARHDRRRARGQHRRLLRRRRHQLG